MLSTRSVLSDITLPMTDHQPRSPSALGASQARSEPMGRHVSNTRDDGGNIDPHVVPTTLLVVAVGPRRPLGPGIPADQVSGGGRGIWHTPVENRSRTYA